MLGHKGLFPAAVDQDTEGDEEHATTPDRENGPLAEAPADVSVIQLCITHLRRLFGTILPELITYGVMLFSATGAEQRNRKAIASSRGCIPLSPPKDCSVKHRRGF